MAKLKFELNRAGVRSLLFSNEMRSILNNTATARYSSAEGDTVEWLAPTRPVIQVHGNNNHNRLLKRMYGGKQK